MRTKMLSLASAVSALALIGAANAGELVLSDGQLDGVTAGATFVSPFVETHTFNLNTVATNTGSITSTCASGLNCAAGYAKALADSNYGNLVSSFTKADAVGITYLFGPSLSEAAAVATIRNLN